MVVLAPTGPVTQSIREVGEVPDDVALSVTATRPEEASPVVAATAVSSDPEAAQRAAAAFPEAILTAMADLEQISSPEAVGVVALTEPGVPDSPASPDPVRNLVIGALIGLVLGLAAAFVREALDVRIKDADDVEAEHLLPVVGEIPIEMRREALPARTHPDSSRAEAYRQVRTHLMFGEATGLPRSILVTSANPGEGKTSLAVNIAELSRRAGQTVVVVDADLRRPAVDDYVLGVRRQPGLSDYLLGKADLAEVLVDSEGLHLVPSGALPKNPSELVGSVRFAEMLRALEDEFDLVVVDGPPVLPVADAIQISVMVQGVLLCARQGETTKSELRRAKDLLERINARIYGVVLMNAPAGEGSYGYRRYGYKGYGRGSKSKGLPVHEELGDARPFHPAPERTDTPQG
jgi:non-specific protein-tyrosine kinase